MNNPILVPFAFFCAHGSGNNFGTGADGDLNTVGNVSFANTTDGAAVVKNYNNVTINVGHLVTTVSRCRGLWIYALGDVIINGSLSMSARGCIGVGDTSNSYTAKKLGIDTLYRVPAIGAVGGPGNGTSTLLAGNAGAAGTGGQCGGGGAGGGAFTGTGGTATSFSGGAGGGGARGSVSCFGDNGGANGGAGGSSAATTSTFNPGAGSGNPGGFARGTACSSGSPGVQAQAGIGGVIFLIVKGSITIGAAGSILGDGVNGQDAIDSGGRGGGGGSGGGSLFILRAGSYTNNGTVRANGGTGGLPISSTANGGNGGAGSITVDQIDA
jgi:hypothetical protein